MPNEVVSKLISMRRNAAGDELHMSLLLEGPSNAHGYWGRRKHQFSVSPQGEDPQRRIHENRDLKQRYCNGFGVITKPVGYEFLQQVK